MNALGLIGLGFIFGFYLGMIFFALFIRWRTQDSQE